MIQARNNTYCNIFQKSDNNIGFFLSKAWIYIIKFYLTLSLFAIGIGSDSWINDETRTYLLVINNVFEVILSPSILSDEHLLITLAKTYLLYVSNMLTLYIHCINVGVKCLQKCGRFTPKMGVKRLGRKRLRSETTTTLLNNPFIKGLVKNTIEIFITVVRS